MVNTLNVHIDHLSRLLFACQFLSFVSINSHEFSIKHIFSWLTYLNIGRALFIATRANFILIFICFSTLFTCPLNLLNNLNGNVWLANFWIIIISPSSGEKVNEHPHNQKWASQSSPEWTVEPRLTRKRDGEIFVKIRENFGVDDYTLHASFVCNFFVKTNLEVMVRLLACFISIIVFSNQCFIHIIHAKTGERLSLWRSTIVNLMESWEPVELLLALNWINGAFF